MYRTTITSLNVRSSPSGSGLSHVHGVHTRMFRFVPPNDPPTSSVRLASGGFNPYTVYVFARLADTTWSFVYSVVVSADTEPYPFTVASSAAVRMCVKPDPEARDTHQFVNCTVAFHSEFVWSAFPAVCPRPT